MNTKQKKMNKRVKCNTVEQKWEGKGREGEEG